MHLFVAGLLYHVLVSDLSIEQTGPFQVRCRLTAFYPFALEPHYAEYGQICLLGWHSREQEPSLAFPFCIAVQPASGAVLATGHVAVSTSVIPKHSGSARLGQNRLLDCEQRTQQAGLC